MEAVSFKKSLILLTTAVFVMCGFFVAGNVLAAACVSNGTGGGAWVAAGTWQAPCNVAGGPVAADTVTISGADTVTTAGNRACAGITITGVLSMANGNVLTVGGNVSGAGTWTTGGGARTISLTGNWSFNGTSTGNGANATFTGTNAQTLSGKITTGTGTLINNKTGGSLTLGSAITIGTFTNTAGTFDASTYLLTATTPTFTAGTLRVGGATWASNYSFAVAEPAAGIIEYYAAGAQTVNDVAYGGSLVISGSGTKTWTLAAGRVITGNLTVNSGAGLTTAGNQTLGVTGTTSVTGTLTLGGTSAKTFTGNVTINSGGVWNETGIAAINFAGNLQHDGNTFTANTGVHTFTVTGKTISGASLIVIPNLTIGAGISTTNNGTLTVSTALAGATGTLVNGATGILKLGGTFAINTLTATAVGNTVNYTGTGQTLKVIAYHHLTLSGGAETFGAITTVAGNLTLSGTATATTGANLAITGNLDVGTGTTFTTGANFTLGVTGTTSVTGNLILANTGTKTFTGDVTLNSGAVWNETGIAAINFAGSLTNTATTFTAQNNAGAVHTFSGTGKTIGGTTATVIPYLTINGTTTNNNTLTVGAILAGSSTLTNAAAGILNIGGTSTITGLTATAVGNTVNYTGTGQTLKVVAYHHLTLSGGAETFGAITTIGGNLTLSGSATATTGANLAIGGNLVIGDGTTFTPASTFTLAVTGTTTVGGGATGNLTISSTSGAKTFTGLVTVNTGATWNNSGNCPVTFRGGITTTPTFTAGSGIQTFDTNSQALTGTFTIPSVTVTGVTLTNNNTLTVSTALSGTGGTLLQAASATLNIGGTSTITTLTATASPNIVDYTTAGGGQTVIGTTYNILTMGNTSGTQTAGGNIIATTLNNNTNASDILNMGTNTLTATTVNNTGTIRTQSTSGTPLSPGLTWGGTVTYDAGSGGQVVVNGTYAILTMGNTSGTQTAGGNIIATTLNNNTNALDILDMSTSTLSATTVNNTGTIRTQNTASSTPLPSGLTWGGTVQYTSGSGAQTVMAGIYGVLTLSNTTGFNTASGDITATTLNTTGGGTLDMSTHDLLAVTTINNSGIIRTESLSGTPLPTGKTWGGTVQYASGSGSQTIMAGTYGVLMLGSHGGSASGDITAASLNTTGGGIFDMGSHALSGVATLSNAGTIKTQNVSGAPLPSGLTWGGAVEFNGAAGQTIPATSTFNDLTINNGSGATLGGNVTANGTLTFTNGKITTGANNLILGSSAAVSGAGSGKYVFGNLRWTLPAFGSPTKQFDIGDSSNYTPASVDFHTLSSGGTLTANTTAGQHPQIASSGIDTSKDVARYWTFTNSGVASTSYDATFTFVAGDKTGGNTANYVVKKYDVGPGWSSTGVGAQNPTNTQGTGMTSFSDFVIGELVASHTVTFDNNGGSGSMSAQTTNVATALTSNTFTRTNYTFSHWNTAANDSGTSYGDGATYGFGADVTLYAQWTALPSHTVTFDSNGGSGSMSAQTTNVATALTSNTFTRAGYTFTNWDTVAVGGGTTYGDGATYGFGADVTLYAQWTATLSSDATLKASSTIKGQTVTSLGTPNATLGSETPGSATISSVQAADTSNAGSYITLFDKTDPTATLTKVVKYAAGSSTAGFATDTAYNGTDAVTNNEFFVAKVTAADSSVLYYNIAVTVTPPLSSDATLKASSTIKGQTVTSLGTPATTIGATTAGSATISSTQAADTSNAGSYITLFDPTDPGATLTKVVKYATGGSTANFATDTAYANEAVTDGDFFVTKVTAADSSVLYYNIAVTVTPPLSSDATLKGSSKVKGQIITAPSLGTPATTIGAVVAGSVTISAIAAADTTNLAPYITLFDPNDPGATLTRLVKYATGASTAGFATDTAYNGTDAITDQDFFIAEVTAADSSILYYDIVVTVAPGLSSDATLATVLSQAITPGGGAGSSGSPYTAPISVANGVSSVQASDIVATNGAATVVFYGSDNTFTTPELGSIGLTAGGSNDVYIKVTAQDTITILYYDVTISRAAPSSDATLSTVLTKTITTSGGAGSSGSPYTASISVVNAVSGVQASDVVATDAGATVYFYGTDNTFTTIEPGTVSLTAGGATDAYIKVIAADSTTTLYYDVAINRAIALSTDATLSNLTISDGALSPVFSAGTTSYSDSVANSTASVTVTPTKNQVGATITVNGASVTSGSASGAITLNVGSNVITIVVTAEDTVTTDTYTINAIRASASSGGGSSGGGGGGGGGSSIVVSNLVQPTPVITPTSGGASGIPGIPAGFTFTNSLAIGSSSQEVVYLKIILAQQNCFTANVNIQGYGALTAAGVKCFQAKYGISQAGVVGPLTRALLNAFITGGTGGTGAPSNPTPTTTPALTGIPGIPAGFVFTKYLIIGSSNQEVVYLKIVLTQQSCFTASTSIQGYGPLTAAGVKCFQAKHGISQAGVVGPLTRAALNALLTKGTTP